MSLGKIYTGHLASDQSWSRPGMDMPAMFWVPAISPSSLMIYDGDKFPLWRGHYFIGALSGQQLQRVAFDQPPPQLERRESMLLELDARIRDVRQGSDGYLYLAVERDQQSGPEREAHAERSILRIEPAKNRERQRCDRRCDRHWRFSPRASCSAPTHTQSASDRRATARNSKPNFSGVWAQTTANWNVLTHGASAGPKEYGALLATPPGYGIVDGDEIPYLRRSRAATAQLRKPVQGRPGAQVLHAGRAAREIHMPYPLQIFHSDGRLLIAYQFAGAARIVNLGKPQPSAMTAGWACRTRAGTATRSSST